MSSPCTVVSIICCFVYICCFFFFNDTATTEIYTLSLHDALPISQRDHRQHHQAQEQRAGAHHVERSEEHTSELQSRGHIVCRLLLEKKKTQSSKAMGINNDRENDKTSRNTANA